MKSLQQHYPTDWQHCFGCGPQNGHGFQLASFWSDNQATATFLPLPHHCAAPGYLYGGIIAALIDCHSIATAAAAAYHAAGQVLGQEPLPRFVTGSLQISYLKPTPMSGSLVLRAHALEIVRRKVRVICELLAGDEVCARGDTLAIAVSETFLAGI